MIGMLIFTACTGLLMTAANILMTMTGKEARRRAASASLGLVSGLSVGALWCLTRGSLTAAPVLALAAVMPLAASSLGVLLGLRRLRFLGLPSSSDPAWYEGSKDVLRWASIEIQGSVLSVSGTPIARGLAVTLLGKRVRSAVAGRQLAGARAEIAAAKARDADRCLSAADREDPS